MTRPAEDGTATGSRARRLALPAALGVIAAGAVLYGMTGGGGKRGAVSDKCAGAKTLSQKLAPLAQGEMAAMGLARTPKPVPELAFEAHDGNTLKFSAFKGRVTLLNLWATWCVPCREEMPALDRLQARLGDADFEVVAINIDTTRLEKRREFLEAAGVTHLAFYADPKAEVFQTLRAAGKVTGLPTTMLIDRAGCEIGILPGEAKWDSEDAVKLIAAAKSG